MTNSGGYKDQKLNKDLYRVVARGNSRTDSEVIYDIFIRRCAEITIENKHDFFSLVSSDKESQTSIVTDPGNVNINPYRGRGRFRNRRGFYNGYGNYNYPPSYSSITRYLREGIIKTFKKGTQPEISFDADLILKNTNYLRN